MRSGKQSGMKKVRNLKKSIHLPGHGKKITDVKMIKLYQQGQSWPYITHPRVFDGRSTRA